MNSDKVQLIKFANRIKYELDNLSRTRIFFAKGEISKKIDKILEEEFLEN